MQGQNNKQILELYRKTLFESLSAFSLWKALVYSRSKKITGGLAEEFYVPIQNDYLNFFGTIEHALCARFVVLSLFPFDRRRDSISLSGLNHKAFEGIEEDHKEILQKFRRARHEVFAHPSIKSLKETQYELGSLEEMEAFFTALKKVYNKCSNHVDKSHTLFDNAEVGPIRDLERLFKNLYRGGNQRKNEIEIKWRWEEDKDNLLEIFGKQGKV